MCFQLVSITAEYTDPFDAVAPRKSEDEQSTTDGYIEPYKAQRLYQGKMSSLNSFLSKASFTCLPYSSNGGAFRHRYD